MVANIGAGTITATVVNTGVYLMTAWGALTGGLIEYCMIELGGRSIAVDSADPAPTDGSHSCSVLFPLSAGQSVTASIGPLGTVLELSLGVFKVG
jgi:hypothetical protein